MYRIFVIILLLFFTIFYVKQSDYNYSFIIWGNILKESNVNSTIYMYVDVNGNTVISNKWHNKSKVVALNDIKLDVRNIDDYEVNHLDNFPKNNFPNSSSNMRQSILIEELKHEQLHYLKDKNLLSKIDQNKLSESDVGYQNYIKELKQSLIERKNNIEILKVLLNIK